MPIHHSGSCRYPYPPDPARTPLLPARFSPFFFTMKLAPMHSDEDIARHRPLYESSACTSASADTVPDPTPAPTRKPDPAAPPPTDPLAP